MPIAATYKGVGIYAGQPAKRVALVKREIDRINKIADLAYLAEIAGDVTWSPEARCLAGAKCIAGLQRATERRESKPDIDVEYVVACAAGLTSQEWAHPFRYCSLLDIRHEGAVKREQPLNEAESCLTALLPKSF